MGAEEQPRTTVEVVVRPTELVWFVLAVVVFGNLVLPGTLGLGFVLAVACALVIDVAVSRRAARDPSLRLTPLRTVGDDREGVSFRATSSPSSRRVAVRLEPLRADGSEPS